MANKEFDWEWAKAAPFEEMIEKLKEHIEHGYDDPMGYLEDENIFELYCHRQEECDAWGDELWSNE